MKISLPGILALFLIITASFNLNGSILKASDSEIPPAGGPSLSMNG